MRFATASYLWALMLVPAVAFGLGLGLTRRRRALQAFVGRRMMDRLVQSASPDIHLLKVIVLTLGVGFLVVSLARPQWGATSEMVSRRGVDVLLGIDISESMMAEDVKPNRLRKALAEASHLLDRFEGDRVGLMAYSGSGGVLCPLTLDYSAVKMFLDALSPDMISFPGTSLSDAIRAGMEAFGTEERKYKVLILFGDGEDQVDVSAVEKAAHDAKNQGLIIHTIGVGTPAGAPIPVRTPKGAISGYKKDDQGRVVTTRLNEDLLARISEMTGGSYFRSSAVESELDRVAEAIEGMDKKRMQGRLSTRLEERFQLPLGLALLFLLAEAFLSGRRRQRGAPSQEASVTAPARATRDRRVEVA
ncbi:MAG: VWA domain-containing protein [Acidobacteriota bacterium]